MKRTSKLVFAIATGSALSLCYSDAFSLSSSSRIPFLKTSLSKQDTKLYAEGGAPQYEKVDGVLKQAEVVGDGSVMLHIDTNDAFIDYEPGHVLALEIQANKEGYIESDKVAEDMKNNDGWMRGPYTVSRATSKSLDVLIKVVGDKSNRFASAQPGTPLKFGGKFKVPILEGIDVGKVKKVVLISTGVGVGPCIGAIEKALDAGTYPPIELIASYKTEDEVLFSRHLNQLAEDNPTKFAWRANVSSKVGRLSSSDKNLQNAFGSGSSFPVEGMENVHYHLIGNGQMVNEFKSGLSKAGVPEDRVTVEMYFNHKAEMNQDAVDRISEAVEAGCVVSSS